MYTKVEIYDLSKENNGILVSGMVIDGLVDLTLEFTTINHKNTSFECKASYYSPIPHIKKHIPSLSDGDDMIIVRSKKYGDFEGVAQNIVHEITTCDLDVYFVNLLIKGV